MGTARGQRNRDMVGYSKRTEKYCTVHGDIEGDIRRSEKYGYRVGPQEKREIWIQRGTAGEARNMDTEGDSRRSEKYGYRGGQREKREIWIQSGTAGEERNMDTEGDSKRNEKYG